MASRSNLRQPLLPPLLPISGTSFLPVMSEEDDDDDDDDGVDDGDDDDDGDGDASTISAIYITLQTSA
jgi:hypothetical protein